MTEKENHPRDMGVDVDEGIDIRLGVDKLEGIYVIGEIDLRFFLCSGLRVIQKKIIELYVPLRSIFYFHLS